MYDLREKSQSLNTAAWKYFEDNSRESMEIVICSAEGLIKYFARLYGGGCSQDDLFQAGSIGLLKAIKQYDPAKTTSFVTYASHCIIGEIRHMVRKEASYYRPGCIVELQAKVDRVIDEHIKECGIAPDAGYIAQKLKIKEESVIEVMRAGFVSFDEIDAAKIHSAGYDTFHLPIEDRLLLYTAMKKLTDIQRKVIDMLFFKEMSQQQVADRLGMSQRQVSRVKENSVEAIRKYMEQ